MRIYLRTLFLLLVLLASFAILANAQSTMTIDASWNDNSTNEEGFILYSWSGGPLEVGQKSEVARVGANVTTLQASVTGAMGQQFCFAVSAFNSAGEALSNTACATIPIVVTVPSAPSNFVVVIKIAPSP